MGDALVARYWCYVCSQMINPVMGAEIQCPFCESGFVEEMDNRRTDENDSETLTNRNLSLWAPILVEIMGGRPSRRRLSVREAEDPETERESGPTILRRRRRNAAEVFRLLQGLQAEMGISQESNGSESERDRGNLIIFNPFNQTIVLQGSIDLNQTQNQSQNNSTSLGDYFLGPGLDLLLQHLADTDPNRNGAPPTHKEAIDAMPTVCVRENLRCAICLEDFVIEEEAKEMPCKHKFHGNCIVPWLELHSTCPVCRFQMPADEESKETSESSVSNHAENDNGDMLENRRGGNGNGRRFWVPVPWPLNGLFSLSGSQSNGRVTSASSSSDTTGDIEG